MSEITKPYPLSWQANDPVSVERLSRLGVAAHFVDLYFNAQIVLEGMREADWTDEERDLADCLDSIDTWAEEEEAKLAEEAEIEALEKAEKETFQKA
jgi:hypothetical protein